jgi:hypothetical protein
VKKLEGIKFFACPWSAITGETWDLLRQINLCTNPSGEIVHLPEPEFSILDQSPRFLRGVEIVRRERNSSWFRELQEQWAKEKAGG